MYLFGLGSHDRLFRVCHPPQLCRHPKQLLWAKIAGSVSVIERESATGGIYVEVLPDSCSWPVRPRQDSIHDVGVPVHGSKVFNIGMSGIKTNQNYHHF